MQYKACIFDLDGTTLNTLKDLQNSMNVSLANNGFPLRSLEEVRHFVGNGIYRFAALACPAGTEEAAVLRVVEGFNTHYALHCNDHTVPYDGILSALSALKGAGMRLATVSNKPDYGVRALCDLHFKGIFDYAVGQREGIPRKPAPDGVFEVLRHFALSPEEGVYIGDSEVDIATAKNAGTDCVAVTWGFRCKETLLQAGATLTVNTPEELQRMLLP